MKSTLLLLVAMLLGACAGVLGIRPKSASHPFEHRQHVLKGINCVQCHGAVGTSVKAEPLQFPTTADCLRCHSKPHDPRPCSGCHGESTEREEVALAREHLRFDHRAHRGPSKGDCVRCHVEIQADDPSALRPAMATCFGCHQHRDQWRTRDCDGCHTDLAAEATLPKSHLLHDGDFVREHGVRAASSRDLCASCHTESSCAGCHGVNVPALPARMAFDQVSLSGLHRAGFRSRHADEARAQTGLCTTCHNEQSCIDCHRSSGVLPGLGSRSPHPAGWLSTFRGGGEHGMQARTNPESCASCHGGAGEQLCVDCHRVGGPGGNPHGPHFESTKSKGRDLPCRQCHGGGG